MAATAGVVAATVGLPALRGATRESVSPALFLADSPTRAIEARVSYPGADVHRPYGPMRSGDAGALPPAPLRELARMEAEGDVHGLAAAYLVRGNTQMAAPYLAKAEDSPDVASDKALLALDKKDYAKALELLEGALKADPKHAQALWNRGLVLKELELWALAAQSFDAVAALEEHGWAAEARARAESLRGRLVDHWREYWDVSEALAVGEIRVPPEMLQERPGLFRASLYEAIRSAPSAEKLHALWPLAEALDTRYGESSLRDAIRWAEARDFRRRGPLAAHYLELYRTHTVSGGLPAYLDELSRAGERDLYMGVLLRERKVQEHMDTFAELAAQVGDPWFLLLAEYERALGAINRGDLLQAEQFLLHAVERCEAHPIGYRCIPIESQLGDLYRQLHRLPESNKHTLAALRGYSWDSRWSETQHLLQLGQTARYLEDAALAWAYLEEALVRNPEDCRIRHFVRANDALALMARFAATEARERMAQALACKEPLSMAGAKTLADLARVLPDAAQDQRLLEGLAARRSQGQLSPGELALATHIEGRFYVERDRKRGEELLQRSIALARELPGDNVDARKTRAYSYASLMLAAAKAGEFERALTLFGEELGGELPRKCMVAVTVDEERTLIVALGPDGQMRGHYDASRAAPLGEDVRGLIPEAMVAPLRACEQVHVVARPPLHGRAGLLPADVAWSYYFLRPTLPPPTFGPVRRLVVADVTAPAALGLPSLNAWDGAPQEGTTLLSGTDATPSRMLEAMESATEVEVHAHGLVNPNLSEASLLVLSPEEKGRYALTAGEVQVRRLREHPLVILAACKAAHGAPWMHERFSLPVAFIEAGARTVLAATVDVPDAEAGPFFNAVRERIRRGVNAAVALRDVRMEWLKRDPESWVRAVLVFD
ncbi:CHAT domain-containing protein [Pyxidicoccus parkwayensis]|uniref:CHAT domain-containing protein n=1 Tax=Pyxidicoccus parkwayensis TaxID=2813578 RepID=A0ABX7NVY0_9BACT|nr:CHAT domain-containing protein [Pyxidicoccus parkwaysis]QSQ22863.1 CHAT domain-containing protein [Pyxidicoccus parkwaysis]